MGEGVAMKKCWALTNSLRRCKNPAEPNSLFCHAHQGWKWLNRWWKWAALAPLLVGLISIIANIVQITDIDIFKIKTPAIPAPPASQKLYFVTVVDASERMLRSIEGSEQKWTVADRSLREKISLIPSGANFGLIAFGGENSSLSPQCKESAEVMVPITDITNLEEPQVGYSQERVLDTVSHIKPGGSGSLTKAISLALDQLISGLPDDYSKTIIVVTGGGDVCDPQTEWDSLEFLLSGAIKDLSIYTELIVLVDEEIKEEVADKVQKISRLDNVTISLPTTPEELDASLEGAVERATERGMDVDPMPFIVQETIVAATQVSQSLNPIPVAQGNQPSGLHEPTLVRQPTSTFALATNLAPLVVVTNTPPFIPTLTPTPFPTYIPPTNTPILISPSNTPTNIPPTYTATNVPPTLPLSPLPDVLIITDPGNGTTFNCPKNEDCIISVTVQWISDTQAQEQGFYLSIWVKPYPGNTGYQFSSQTEVSYLGNGFWQSNPVYIGQINVDDPGTPFAIHAIVTDQPYPTDQHLSPLPTHSRETSIEIAR